MKASNETEIKLKIGNPRQLKRRLRELGFRQCGPRVYERNTLFDFQDRRLAKASCALRLRSAGGRHWLTFKGKPFDSRKYKTRLELESGVENQKPLAMILGELGLHPVIFYEKHRTTYAAPSRGSCSLAFDETAAGTYVELEGPRRWIRRVAAQLGFSENDYVTSSYVNLLSQAHVELRIMKGRERS
jgi:predicted adenylyl cyclase CyaB